MPLNLSLTGTAPYADEFDRPDGAPGGGWVFSGLSAQAIDGGQLKLTGAGVEGRAQAGAAAARASGYIDTMIRRETGAEAGVFARMGASAYYLVQFFGANCNLFHGPGFSGVAGAGFPLVSGQLYRVQFYYATGEQKVWVNGALLIDAADASGDGAAGQPGYRSTVNLASMHAAYMRDFARRTITVTNLPAGYSVRVKDGGGAVVAGPTAAVAGTATVDLGGVALPYARVEVLDAGAAPRGDGVWEGAGYVDYTFDYVPVNEYVRTAVSHAGPATSSATRTLLAARAATSHMLAGSSSAVGVSEHLLWEPCGPGVATAWDGCPAVGGTAWEA